MASFGASSQSCSVIFACKCLLPHPSPSSLSLPLSLSLSLPPSCRPPGHLSPRMVSSAMRNKIFRTSLQQDSQEFLRCLLMQIHDETAVEVPSWSADMTVRPGDTPPGNTHRDSLDSSTSHDLELGSNSGGRNSPLVGLAAPDSGGKTQPKSSPLPRKKGGLARLSLKQKSSGSSQSLVQSSPTAGHRRFALRASSSLGKTRGGSREAEEIGGRSHQLAKTGGSQVSLESQPSDDDAVGVVRRGEEGEVYEVDMVTRRVTLHRNCHLFDKSSNQQQQSGCQNQSEGDTKSAGRKTDLQSSPQSRLRGKRVQGQGGHSAYYCGPLHSLHSREPCGPHTPLLVCLMFSFQCV